MTPYVHGSPLRLWVVFQFQGFSAGCPDHSGDGDRFQRSRLAAPRPVPERVNAQPVAVEENQTGLTCSGEEVTSFSQKTLNCNAVVQIKPSLVSMCSLVDEIPVIVQPLQRSLPSVLCGHLEIRIVSKATCSPLCLCLVGEGGPAFCSQRP